MSLYYKVPIETVNGVNSAKMDYTQNHPNILHYTEDYVYMKFLSAEDVTPNEYFTSITEEAFNEVYAQIQAMMDEQQAQEKVAREEAVIAEQNYKAAVLLSQAQILSAMKGVGNNESVL